LNPYRALVGNPKRINKENLDLGRIITLIYLRGLFGSGMDCILLRVFENRVLRMIFGPRRDEMAGEWRKLHNEELRDLYSSLSITRIIKSRRMRWAGHVARMEENRNAYRLLVGRPEGKRPLGRPRRRWVDNIGMDLGDVGWGDVDGIGLAQDRNRWRAVVNSVLNLRVP
jgi:hypothetical protein